MVFFKSVSQSTLTLKRVGLLKNIQGKNLTSIIVQNLFQIVQN